MACAELDPAGFGDYRTLNSPGLSPSAGEIAEAVRTSGAAHAGRITFEPNPDVERIVAAWPKYMEAERAKALGLTGDASVQEIVREYRASRA
jgi:hypothetical protein